MSDYPRELWRHALRYGFLWQFTDSQLMALQAACLSDSPRIGTGITVFPPPGPMEPEVHPEVPRKRSNEDRPCECLCPVAYALSGAVPTAVGVAHDRYQEAVGKADRALAESGLSSRAFLRWADDSPRAEVLREIGRECAREVARRRGEPVVEFPASAEVVDVPGGSEAA